MRSVLVLTLFIIPATLPYTFTEKFGRCHVKDANLDNCLKTNIQEALQLIGSSGIASINLPSIEPLEADRVEIATGRSKVNFEQKYEEVKVYGFSKTAVEDAHLDLDKNILTFTTYSPTLTQKAKYNINGKVLEMIIRGSGDSVITFSGMRIKHTLHFKEEIKNTLKYFKITSYKIGMSIEKAHFDYANLNAGDKQTSEMVIKGMNEYGVLLFNEIRQGVEDAYSQVYKNVADKLFANIPVDEIFLP